MRRIIGTGDLLSIAEILGFDYDCVKVKGVECPECGHTNPNDVTELTIRELCDHGEFAYAEDIDEIEVQYASCVTGKETQGTLLTMVIDALGYEACEV